ncbi:MAG: transferase hexapeptide repeat family protein [Bacteroidia bacterium]|nr:transferase hexapeptide repeat family protein [Bacteroidia bacterium]
MAFYSFKGSIPHIHPTSFVHPQASVIGNVFIGKNVYIGPFASLRADFGSIIIHDGSNIQDSCTIHMFPGVTVVLEEMAHIGHGAIVHGARIGKNALIGMHAVIMDDAEVGENAVVGALSFVPAGMKIPPNTLAAGNPAKIIKEVKEEMVEWKTQGTLLYQQLADDCIQNVNPCQPKIIQNLNEIELPLASSNQHNYKSWNKSNKK